MPSVELLQKVMGQDWDVFSDPMRPAIVIVEHKIRNLEKRKAKLDQYKAEQSQGKDLNADQLSAVSKYTEVTQQLDLARDLVKQFTEISTEVKRQIKREQRKENAERLGATTDKIRQLLFFQSILTEVNRQNYLKLMKGSSDINIEEQFDQDGLDSISSYLLPSFRDANFDKTLHEAAEHAINLIDGKPKKVNRVNDRTYKEVKEMLVNISQSDRFSSLSQVTDSVNNPTVPEQSSETESVPSPVSNEPIVKEPPPPAPVVPIQESTYSFLQESTIDIESPHMDPAVVAVSSFIPPPISQTATVQRAVFTNSNMSANHVGMNDGNLQSQMENLNMDGQITTWNEEAVTGKPNKSAHNDLHDDYNNGDASNNRMKGGFRGGRGGSRGKHSTSGPGLNGFSRGGGYRGSRGGFGNGERVERIGYYKPETQEKDFDNRGAGDAKFHGENRGRGGGHNGGPFRRGNSRNGNSSRGGGDGYRGSGDGYRGSGDGYRGSGDGYRGSGDGYRGGNSGFRGNRPGGGRPQRTGNDGVSSEGY